MMFHSLPQIVQSTLLYPFNEYRQFMHMHTHMYTCSHTKHSHKQKHMHTTTVRIPVVLGGILVFLARYGIDVALVLM